MGDPPDVTEKLSSLLKRRAFLAPSYEIYGGVAGFFDYGPLGAELKHNLENLWRSYFVLKEGMAEIESPTLSPESVFKASGHLEKFSDTLLECSSCGSSSRADHLLLAEYDRFEREVRRITSRKHEGLWEEVERYYRTLREKVEHDPSVGGLSKVLDLPPQRMVEGDRTLEVSPRRLEVRKGEEPVFVLNLSCPSCGKPLDPLRLSSFNLMFKTSVGAGSSRPAYLRPETAQGIFILFPWLLRHFRDSLPFGAVQIGKAYRNEISPRQSLLRLREFHQMEAEVFFDPNNKFWPGAHDLSQRPLPLLPKQAQERGSEEVVFLTPKEAVEKGVVTHQPLSYFLALTDLFLEECGIPLDRRRMRQHLDGERAHYSSDTWDVEYLSGRFGWVEIVGIADRTDYDLRAHSRVSGTSLVALRRYPTPRTVEEKRVAPLVGVLGPLFRERTGEIIRALESIDPQTLREGSPLPLTLGSEEVVVPPGGFRIETVRVQKEGEEFVPHVVEPSFGVDRILYAILECAFSEREWIVLRLPPSLSPLKVGVFPLMPKDGLDTLARRIERDLRWAGIRSYFDDSGSIGRRYARSDEIGTPWCVTVDYETLSDGTVTIRERDSALQRRIPTSLLVETLRGLLSGERRFEDLPKPHSKGGPQAS